MQVNATILAAQQAAREARATLFAAKPAAPAASFLVELDKEGVAAPAAPKQAAAAAPAAQAPMRMGSLLDIKV